MASASTGISGATTGISGATTGVSGATTAKKGGKKRKGKKGKKGATTKTAATSKNTKVSKKGSRKVSRKGSKASTKTTTMASASSSAPKKSAAANNQMWIDKITALMSDVRPHHVTRHNKADLDMIQTLIKNIMYREWDQTKAIIKQITGGVGDEGQSTAAVDEASLPKQTHPFEKIVLIPTRQTEVTVQTAAISTTAATTNKANTATASGATTGTPTNTATASVYDNEDKSGFCLNLKKSKR
ncbi:hypothetical protein BLOT_006051 [Blomia tropicalis]|nr:hypothetical protein BLOT_006051 [Blomia tropicalis]